MHEGSIVLAKPQSSEKLILLFHGVGSSAQDLAPLGEALALARPNDVVISVQAPYPSQLGRGQEWFSVIGVTEENRPNRIALVMPLFLKTIRHWQDITGIDAKNTVLIGFSQGAIMALEATQTPEQIAGKVIAMAGRFAQPVRQAPTGMQVHLIHGDRDGVIAPQWSTQAVQEIKALGGKVTLDQFPGLGHGIDVRVVQQVIHYLTP
jgi:phospholipase/carboxylesterase